jgi:methionine--tRNA ligase beta chain
LITFDDFAKLDLRVAKIKNAELVEGADKLLKLTLDVGELGERVIASAIKPWYAPEKLVGKSIVYLANLEPRVLRGVTSQGMLLAASTDDDLKVVLLSPHKKIAPGTRIH